MIPVLIQKNADQYVGPSDLLQKWKNGAEYIFLEAKDDVDELASFMKANEMDGAKSVHFVFANSPPEGRKHQTTSLLISRGFPMVSMRSKRHAPRPNRLFSSRPLHVPF